MVNIGPKIGIDGYAEYKKQIGEIVQSTKTLKSEFDAISTSTSNSLNPFKNLSNELANNKAAHENLGAQIAETSAKLELQKQALAEAEKAGSDNTQGINKWKQAVADSETELNSLKSQLDDMPNSLNIIGGALQDVGGKMQDIGGKLTTSVTLPLVGVGAMAVSSFADVDKTMQLTNATMGNTEEQAKTLETAMKDAASNSTFGMSDAATATLNFARAGLDAEQSASALAPAMNLAAGEGGSLDTVSSGLVATINGFGGSFDEASTYADVFANACNNSALDVDSLASSMSTAAPVFSAAGYSVNDAALYMGVMANAGIDAGEAATSLKTGFARLVDPTDEAAEMMDQLGLSVVNADGSMKDTTTIQEELHNSFADMSESEQIAAASAIFGKNQMDKWLALINTAPEDVASLSSALDEEGTTAEMSEAMMSGFGGSLEKLKSSVDVLMSSLGEALAPTIQAVSDKIQEIVDWFNSLDEEQQQTIATIGLVVAAAGPVIAIVGTIVSVVGSVLSVIGTIGGAISTLVGVISGGGGIIAALGGVGAAIGPVLAAAAPVIAVIGGIVGAGILLYQNWDTIKEKAGQLKEWVSEKWNNLKEATVEKFNEIKEGAIEKWNNMKETVSTTVENFKTDISTKWDNLKTSVSNTVTNLKNDVETKWDNLKTNVSNTLSNLKSDAETKWENLKTNVSNTVENLKSSVSTKWENLKSTSSTIWNGLKTEVSNRADNIKTNATNMAQNITDTYNRHGGGWSGILAGGLAAAKSAMDLEYQGIDTLTGGALSALQTQFTTLRDAASSWGTDMIENFKNGINAKLEALASAVEAAANAVKSKLGFSEPEEGPLSNFHTYAPDMMKLYAKGIDSNLWRVEDAVSNVAASIGATMDQNQYVSNVGGVNIVVNAANGQSAEDIADIVQERINREVMLSARAMA